MTVIFHPFADRGTEGNHQEALILVCRFVFLLASGFYLLSYALFLFLPDQRVHAE
jgi:hypothetical protein